MTLDRVTITGADDHTSILEMVDISEEFPFVEWGILVSKSREGSARYPSRRWCRELTEHVHPEHTKRERVAMHVCGLWARQVFDGSLLWSDIPSVRLIAQRFQINGKPPEFPANLNAVNSWVSTQFIFQVPSASKFAVTLRESKGDAAVLFDRSGGHGKSPSELERPWPTWYCGWAGGIGPDNARETAQRIETMAPRQPFWLDMEGRVRDEDDRLDMRKVVQVLESVKGLVNAGVTP